MLGDGCLYLGKNFANAQFCYTSKSRQHVEYVCKEFMKWSYREGIKYYSYNDKRTNKIYSRYTYRSISGTGFTTEYNRWYENGTKHIPKDLKLNPLICLIWYIGDGGINHSNRSECIKLSTQCFLKTEQEKILIPQLQQFSPKLMAADIGFDGKRQYFIYIPHIKEKEFLDYIGECPFDDYKYKWNISGYKNSVPQNHTNKEKIFCDMFRKGMTYYSIAKEFKIEPNAVKYYLKKNNLYKGRSYT